MYILKLVSLK